MAFRAAAGIPWRAGMGEVEKLVKGFERDIALTKARILRRRRYSKYKAILSQILDDGVTYTLSVVARLLIEALSKQIEKIGKL